MFTSIPGGLKCESELWQTYCITDDFFIQQLSVCGQTVDPPPPPPLKSPVYNLNCATLKGFALFKFIIFLGKVTIQTRKYDIMPLKLGN